MKKILKYISTISILLFLVLWILSKFIDKSNFETIEIRNILVLIYLVTSLKHYKMEVEDKNIEIQDLKMKLEASKK